MSSKYDNYIPKSTVNNRIVFPLIALSLLMITVDSTIVATALHTLQTDLNTSVSWAGWTMTSYSFGMVLILPLSANLSVQIGHRRIFIISVLIFTVASLLCGLAPNIQTLIAMRVLQAFGGSGITPSATGIIVQHFGKSRDRYLGLFGSFFAIGSMIGPVFGGIFVTYLTWEWIFFINIPFGIIAAYMAYKLIPKDEAANLKNVFIDFKGLFFLAAAIMSGMYAATYLGDNADKPFSALFISLFLISVLFFTIFFRHIRKSEKPFIDPKFIIGKGFSAVNVINIVHSGMVIGALALVPLYAVSRYGISELHSGTLLVAEGVASVIMSIVLSIYLRKTGYRMPIYAGGIVLSFGVALLYFAPPLGITPYVWLAISTFFIGFGIGVMSPAARNAGIQLAPTQSANIAAIRSLGLQLGQIITVAISTAIITASENPTSAHATIYLVFAAILFITLYNGKYVPENKGAW